MAARNVLVITATRTNLETLSEPLRSAQCSPTFVADCAWLGERMHGAPTIVQGTLEFARPFLHHFAESRRQGAPAALIVIAESSSEAYAVEALRAGAAEYLTAPVEPRALQQTLARWLAAAPEPSTASSAKEIPLAGGEGLVGSSPEMQALRANVRQLAATDCNVLVTGETGTGKELVAELIHLNSARRQRALVCINCAAIPDALLESELFGHERGAFTGASSHRAGKLMTADKGTVFFDEIGDMSLCAQAKVLRAIEAKEVQRLGASTTTETDIRIVAATHKRVDDLANSGEFRKDLYFRLNVGRIHIPPLRERKADIPQLAQRFVVELNRKLGCRIEGFTDDVLARLSQHDWPGNVRELRNVIERVFVIRDSGVIGADDLARCLATAGTRAPRNAELECLLAALTTCHWNKSKAAEKLNWSRMTLYRKLAKYNLTDHTKKRAHGRSSGRLSDAEEPTPECA